MLELLDAGVDPNSATSTLTDQLKELGAQKQHLRAAKQSCVEIDAQMQDIMARIQERDYALRLENRIEDNVATLAMLRGLGENTAEFERDLEQMRCATISKNVQPVISL